MTEKWADAVKLASEDMPADLGEAVRNELADLWNDLSWAIYGAYNGSWSMQCENITTRIVRLSRLAGPTPWEKITASLLLDGTYQGILASAGIQFGAPGEDDLREMREFRAKQRAAARAV